MLSFMCRFRVNRTGGIEEGAYEGLTLRDAVITWNTLVAFQEAKKVTILDMVTFKEADGTVVASW